MAPLSSICACSDCECKADDAFEKDGKAFCSKSCANGHIDGNGCGHGCGCSG